MGSEGVGEGEGGEEERGGEGARTVSVAAVVTDCWATTLEVYKEIKEKKRREEKERDTGSKRKYL